jgi:TonB family protein
MIRNIFFCFILLHSINSFCQKFYFNDAMVNPLTKDPALVTLKVLRLIQNYNEIDSLKYWAETKEISQKSDFINNIKFAQSEVAKYSKIYPDAEFRMFFGIDSNRRVIMSYFQNDNQVFLNIDMYYECSCGKLKEMLLTNKQKLDQEKELREKPFKEYKEKNGVDSIEPPPPPPLLTENSIQKYKIEEECKDVALGSENIEEEIPFVLPVMPTFIGGQSEMIKFIKNNLKYPSEAKINKTTGTVYVSFIVETNGTLTNFKILKDIGDGCGEEAIRVIKTMPKWKPGEKEDGTKVRAGYNVSIEYTL